MQFSEGNLFQLVFGFAQHFKIPDFQRAYSWDKKMWAMLWIDIINQYKIHADLVSSGTPESEIHTILSKKPTHYLGAIVTTTGTAMIPPPSDVLDGQQRLLTSSIVYLAIRDSILKQLGTGQSTSDQVQETKDNFKSAFFNTSGNDKTKYRLLTQDVDRSSWEYLLSPGRPIGLISRSHFQPPAGHSDRVIQAFNYFYKEINRQMLDEHKLRELEFAAELYPLNIDILKSVVETRLSLVRLMCGVDDDANAIFESLNAKSEPLKQVDLIKNYIYISLPSDEASEVYRTTWRPMEVIVESDRIERFVWAVVVSMGNPTLQKRTYETVRALLANRPQKEIRKWVEQLAVEARYYKSIVEPEFEVDEEVKRSLQAVKFAGGSTMEPLLIYAYRSWSLGKATKQEFISAVKSIESFLVRRMLAGEKTQVLNSMVTSMINRLYTPMGQFEGKGDLVSDIRRVLSAEDLAWPDSEAILSGIKFENFYSAQKTEQRLHVLRAIDSFFNKTGVTPNYEMSDKTIEHIIPQTPSGSWADGDNDYRQEIKERLHSLSNLTLIPSAINSSLGNKSWKEKVAIYEESPYSITSSIAKRWKNLENWGIEALDERAQEIAVAVDSIWPKNYVGPHFIKSESDQTQDEITDDFDSDPSEEIIIDDLENGL